MTTQVILLSLACWDWWPDTLFPEALRTTAIKTAALEPEWRAQPTKMDTSQWRPSPAPKLRRSSAIHEKQRVP